MLYLLDANALITAHNTWYGHKRVPEFWRWLIHNGQGGTVKMPAEIYAEVEGGTDELATWMHDVATKKALLLGEASDPDAVQAVLGLYGEQVTEADLITIGQDPFLIAAALGRADRCVVTAEVSKPTRTGARRHVPDVCGDCGVSWMHPIAFIAELNFSTDWDIRLYYKSVWYSYRSISNQSPQVTLSVQEFTLYLTQGLGSSGRRQGFGLPGPFRLSAYGSTLRSQ